jgi:hypothetical protein
MKRASEVVSRTLDDRTISITENECGRTDSQNDADENFPVEAVAMVFVIVKE